MKLKTILFNPVSFLILGNLLKNKKSKMHNVCYLLTIGYKTDVYKNGMFENIFPGMS